MKTLLPCLAAIAISPIGTTAPSQAPSLPTILSVTVHHQTVSTHVRSGPQHSSGFNPEGVLSIVSERPSGPQSFRATIALTHLIPGTPFVVAVGIGRGAFAYPPNVTYAPNSSRDDFIGPMTPSGTQWATTLSLPTDSLTYATRWHRPAGIIFWDITAGPPGLFPNTVSDVLNVQVVAHYAASATAPKLALTAPTTAIIGRPVSLPVTLSVLPSVLRYMALGALHPLGDQIVQWSASYQPVPVSPSTPRPTVFHSVMTHAQGDGTIHWTPTHTGHWMITAMVHGAQFNIGAQSAYPGIVRVVVPVTVRAATGQVSPPHLSAPAAQLSLATPTLVYAGHRFPVVAGLSAHSGSIAQQPIHWRARPVGALHPTTTLTNTYGFADDFLTVAHPGPITITATGPHGSQASETLRVLPS